MQDTIYQETGSPIAGMTCDFKQYVKDKKAVEAKRMSGSGLPDYAYSFDYEYRKKLDAIPHFYSLAKKYCGTYASRQLQIANQSGMLVGPNQFPDVYEIGRDCARRLGIAIPNIYILNSTTMNAYTIATDDVEPFIVVYSGLYERMTPGELRCVIGHECGHIHNKHGIYSVLQTIIVNMGLVTASSLLPQLSEFLTLGAEYLLYAWSRAAEVTCDRAGMICCERIEDAYSVNAKLLYGAAIGDKNTVNLEALKEQLKMQMDTIVRIEELESDHPTSVRRIAAEMEFAECEVFYQWRPELKKPGLETRSREETDERCHKVIDVVDPKQKRKGKS